MKEEREMESRNLIDSLASALLPPDREPLDSNTGSAPNDCPPDWPKCGTDPAVKEPASTLVERAAPAQP